MTTKELYNRITLGTCVSGQFTVAIEYRGEEYTCKSNNTLAYDAIRFDADPKESHAIEWFLVQQHTEAVVTSHTFHQ